MINSFWKKATLLNFGLFIIIVRIYGYIIDKLNSKANLTSLFPSSDENGYSFEDQILCGLKQLKYISDKLNKGINNEKYNISYINNEDKCLFYKKIEKCPHYIFCENKFVTYNFNNNSLFEILKDEGSIYWNIIFNLNYYQNRKSMNFLYKIFSGYMSFVHIILYKHLNNINDLKERVTSSYEKLNNLFYFESLLLKSYLQLENEKLIIFDKTFDKEYLNDYMEECIIKIDKDVLNLQNEIKDETMVIIEKVKEIISYIAMNDTLIKDKGIFDVNSLETMFKILFNYETSNDEIKQFKYFLTNIIKCINFLFEVDSQLNDTSKKYQNYSKYTSIILIIFSCLILIFMNYNFLKNKNNKNKNFFFNKNKGLDIRKYQIYKQNLEKIKQKQNLNKPISYESFSKEEQELIDKLLQNNPKK
jgi:hypothetical protein